LSSGSDDESVNNLFSSVLEQARERGFLGRDLVHRGDGRENEFDMFRIGLDIIDNSNNLSSLFISTLESEPSRRLGESESECNDDKSEDTSGHTGESPVPRRLSFDLRESECKP
jgi:hypothetical protein